MYSRLTSLQWDMQVIPNWKFKHLACITHIRIEFDPLSKKVEHAIVINSLFSYRKILTTSSEYDIRFYPKFKIFS